MLSPLPRYEGHLALNRAILSDAPQTSACTAWSQFWCSLEDGKLLVYTDRTAAIVNPDDTCACIDIRAYACVQCLPTNNQSFYEFVLRTSLAEPSRSARLFRPKSSHSLDKLQNNLALPEMVQSDRCPIKTRHASLALSNKADGESRLSSRNKSWTRFTSGTRRLHSKISASNGSLRTSETVSLASRSTTSSVASIRDSIESMDVDSMGASSPRTPVSITFGSALDRVPIRVSSSDELHRWIEALSLTMKTSGQVDLTASAMVGQRRRASTRPSLSNLPGFHSPRSLKSSPVLPSEQPAAWARAEEATPKASHKRQASSTSIPLTFFAEQQVQPHAVVGSGLAYPRAYSGANIIPTTNINIANDASIAECMENRGSRLKSSLSFTSQAYAVSGFKRAGRDPRHKRSISTASSSFSLSNVDRVPVLGRKSVSSAQLLSSEIVDTSLSNHPNTGFVETGLQAQSTPNKVDNLTNQEPIPIVKRNSDTTLPLCKHGRSNSILRFGSARIVEWRDEFMSFSPKPKTEANVGLGLDVEPSCMDDCCALMDVPTKSKSWKRFQRLRSFRLLAKTHSRIGNEEGEGGCASSSWYGESLSWNSRKEMGYSQEVSNVSGSRVSQTIPAKGKGMFRSTSLLNLTKTTLGSMRAKPNVRESVKAVIDDAQEKVGMVDDSYDSGERSKSCSCDFSYELVEADKVESRNDISGVPAQDTIQNGQEMVQQPEKVEVEDKEARFSVERILPPEQMISTFDQLRAADPFGQSCDWLHQLEFSSRQSVDWTTQVTTSTSPTFQPHTTSSTVNHTRESSSGFLRSSFSACNLPTSANIPPHDSPSMLHEPTLPLRSLPAPPRSTKRRPVPNKTPFTNITNKLPANLATLDLGPQ